jgi:hypothetical protein
MANSLDKINALAYKFHLSETVKEAIIEISKEAYIQGSNSASKVLKAHQDTVKQTVKSELNKILEKWLT